MPFTKRSVLMTSLTADLSNKILCRIEGSHLKDLSKISDSRESKLQRPCLDLSPEDSKNDIAEKAPKPRMLNRKALPRTLSFLHQRHNMKLKLRHGQKLWHSAKAKHHRSLHSKHHRSL